ncbi:MAG: hypothetical protein KJO82_01490, partial [Gammaproteobacteria bacterium]|nr:hypothetical protein [Gammaproteobacteria bacterium]
MPAGRQHYGGLDPHTGPIDYENDSMGMWDQSAGDTFELPMKRVLRDVVDARTRCLGTGGEGSLWQLLLDDGEGKIVYHPPDFKITVDQTIYDGNVKYVGASRKTSVIECLQDSNYTRVTAVGAGSATIGMILSKAEYEAGQPGNEFPAIGDSVSFSFENVRFEWTRSDAVSTPNLFILNNVDNGYITHCDFITTENDTYYYTPIDCARGVSGFEVSHSYFEINCEDLQGGLWIRSLNHTKPTENIHYHHLHVVSNTNDEPLSVFADDTTNSGPLRNIKVDHILFEMVGPNCNGPSMTNNAWGPTGTVNEPIEKPELDFDAHMSNLTVVMWNMNRFCFQLKNAHG